MKIYKLEHMLMVLFIQYLQEKNLEKKQKN
jgi:hypothetical protein